MATLPQIHQRRLLILAAIQTYHNLHHRPPTLRELCDMTDISSTSLMDWHLDVLESEGLITREPGKARTIRLTGEAPKDVTVEPKQVQEVAKKRRNYYGSSDAPVVPSDEVVGLPYPITIPPKVRRKRKSAM